MSKRSKKHWANLSKHDRKALTSKITAKLRTDAVREKISKSIKEKFDDPDYIRKVSEARKKYWENYEYRKNRTLSIDEFIERSKSVHGDKYDYSKVQFDSARNSKVDIICPDHGVFRQRPLWHYLYGNGCPDC